MPSVCVFCGSLPKVSGDYLELARSAGHELAARGWTLVYGGARRGLMGAIADAALERGGRVHGVIPRALVEREVAHTGLTELDIVGDMQTRKARMAELCDAFLTLPGGFGTLDELFEMLTWTMLGLQQRPTVLVNWNGYYDHLVAFLDRARADGFLPPGAADQLLVAADLDSAFALLAARIGTPV